MLFEAPRVSANPRGRFPVTFYHRLVLVKASSYFRALLTGGLQEAVQAEVDVAIEAALLRPVLRFLYAGDGAAAGVDSANATELLGVAGMLQASSRSVSCGPGYRASVPFELALLLCLARPTRVYLASQVPELARCCEAVIAGNVTTENVAAVLAMARGESSGGALVAWCERFAVRSLPAAGAVDALAGAAEAEGAGAAGFLLPMLTAECRLRELI